MCVCNTWAQRVGLADSFLYSLSMALKLESGFTILKTFFIVSQLASNMQILSEFLLSTTTTKKKDQNIHFPFFCLPPARIRLNPIEIDNVQSHLNAKTLLHIFIRCDRRRR